MRRKFAGVTFVSIGAVLILSALLLFLYTLVNDSVMAQQNQEVYEELVRIVEEKRAAITSTTDEISQEQTADTIEQSDNSLLTENETIETNPIDTMEHTPMSVVRIGDFDYIGFLDIPSLTLSLPVLADSDEESLRAAPCRQFGSPETDDFVIAGHNYRRHFANLYKLKIDDTVHFSDMDGDTVIYKVAVVTTVDATDVEAVIDTPYDLILYTCDFSGNNRIAVFCERK